MGGQWQGWEGSHAVAVSGRAPCQLAADCITTAESLLHGLSHTASHALSVIHAHACVYVMACGNYYITIFQLSRSV